MDVIVSKCDQTIKIRDQEIKVKKSEVILTARSKKWDLEEMEEEMKAIGVKPVKYFFDKKNYFTDAIFEK